MTGRLSRLESIEALERAMLRAVDRAGGPADGSVSAGEAILRVIADHGLDLDVATLTELWRDKSLSYGAQAAAQPSIQRSPLPEALASVVHLGVGEGLALGLLLADELRKRAEG